MNVSNSSLEHAIKLRQEGRSLREIAEKTKISKATLSIKLRSLSLNTYALNRINQLKIKARNKGLTVLAQRVIDRNMNLAKATEEDLASITLSKNYYRIIAALLFWGEGNKSGSFVGFINSDPKMVATFLQCLRKGYQIDETKFRVLIHLHQYHNKISTLSYWSTVTNVPLTQFTKPYMKEHSGKTLHQDYKGACRIRYYDAQIAHSLTAIYNTLSKNILGV